MGSNVKRWPVIRNIRCAWFILPLAFKAVFIWGMRTPEEVASFYAKDFDLARQIYRGEA